MSLSTFDYFKRVCPRGATIPDAAALKALQSTLALMLDDIVAVCGDAGIEYALGGGSALGAVRHRGFIPWDDDLDVNIRHCDWARFRESFCRRFGEKYAIYEPGSPVDYRFAFPRIRLRGTSAITRDDAVDRPDCCGVTVDFFWLENTFDNSVLRALQGLLSLAVGLAYSCRKAFDERQARSEWGIGTGTLRLKSAVGFCLAVASVGWWTRLWTRVNGICSCRDSRYVTFPVGRRHFFGELATREELGFSGRGEFEGRMVPLHSGVDRYLRRLYGSRYMEIPPQEKRERHAYFPPFVPELT